MTSTRPLTDEMLLWFSIQFPRRQPVSTMLSIVDEPYCQYKCSLLCQPPYWDPVCWVSVSNLNGQCRVYIELTESLVTLIIILNIYLHRAQYFALRSEVSRIVRRRW